ncbi:MAG TPA: homoserine kinase [Terracidiphilus sp.]|jgi:homoserine kinase|nr:homoserine kinase [Terracidiphilus sp.]HUX28155.1 homoserine kinase [Terracidiphilus sp.]
MNDQFARWGDGESSTNGMRLRLPATSANLGPGFDSVAVGLNFYLEMDAEPAAEFSIAATGRNADRCGQVEDNLILETYKGLLVSHNRPIVPLAIQMRNEIPLAMGCGSSAAGRLAAIALAVHFGQLGWSSERILYEAYLLEGHPDNVAACWLGGFVAAACEGNTVHAVQVTPPAHWRVIVVLPADSLATSKARAVLPASYPLNDVVANIQSVAMLGLAFAQGRGDLLRTAMSDRIHQPYRAPICSLLPVLLPLVGEHGILGAALSGAGPAVLAIVESEASLGEASAAIRRALGNALEAELMVCRFEDSGASVTIGDGVARPVENAPRVHN